MTHAEIPGLPRDHAVIGSDRTSNRAGGIESNRVRGRVPLDGRTYEFQWFIGCNVRGESDGKEFFSRLL